MINEKNNNLLIRADGGTGIGCGHVMRSLSLAAEWRKSGGNVLFISSCPPELSCRIEKNGITFLPFGKEIGSVEDACDVVNIANKFNAGWILLDGYHFIKPDDSYISILKDAKYKVCVIDDIGITERCNADMIVNQNIYASFKLYRECKDSLLLTGIRFFMLGHRFCSVYEHITHTGIRTDDEIRILVTMGGADSKNATSEVIKILSDIKNKKLNITVVVGAAFKYKNLLENICKKSAHKITIIYNTNKMADIISQNDVAISAAGTTAYEIAYLHVPALHIVIADNQRLTAKFMDAIGVSVNLGNIEKLKPESLTEALGSIIEDKTKYEFMRKRCENLIDGKGQRRIIEIMLKQINREITEEQKDFILRKAEWSDVVTMWHMANDPIVRENSLSPEKIPFSNHVNWFEKKLANPKTRIWLAEVSGAVVGQVRYDKVSDSTAEIDIHTAPCKRSRGIGKRLLMETLPLSFKSLNVHTIEAVILTHNMPSIALFKAAGFKFKREETFVCSDNTVKELHRYQFLK